MWKNLVHTDEQRRTAFVELERHLWRRVLGRLRKVTPKASV
jgi:hypothetical protein